VSAVIDSFVAIAPSVDTAVVEAVHCAAAIAS
jgi:hypothetical protein